MSNKGFERYQNYCSIMKNCAIKTPSHEVLSKNIITSLADALSATRQILEHHREKGLRYVGLDTETSINGANLSNSSIVSVIQIYYHLNSEEYFYLFQMERIYLNNNSLPKDLKTIIQCKTLIKVGVDITTDMKRLEKSFKYNPSGFIDLQSIAYCYGIDSVSMDSLVENFILNEKIPSENNICNITNIIPSKNITHHYDWDGELDHKQILYAYNDAKRSYLLFIALMKQSNRLIEPMTINNLNNIDEIETVVPMNRKIIDLSLNDKTQTKAVDNDSANELTENKIMVVDSVLPSVVCLGRVPGSHLPTEHQYQPIEINTEDEMQLLYQWIKKQLKTSNRDRPIEKMIIHIVNSYKPWVNIQTESKKVKAKSAIDYLSNKGLLKVKNNKLIPDRPSIYTIAIDETTSTYINTHKLEGIALYNYLLNSYSPIQFYDNEEKSQWALSVVNSKI